MTDPAPLEELDNATRTLMERRCTGQWSSDGGHLDTLISALISATTDEVRDEDGDDEEGESDADGDRDDVVRTIVTVQRRL